MGSGSTGVACINLNRNFIGIEKPKHTGKEKPQLIPDNKLLIKTV